MNEIIFKAISTLRTQGMKSLVIKTKRYAQKYIMKQQDTKEEDKRWIRKPHMVDVLFVNGCDVEVPHPARYRVTHQREQLYLRDISSAEVFYKDLRSDYIRFAHTIIFFRCPYTDAVGESIAFAKTLNKLVLFDVDDLVIDTKYTNQIPYVCAMPESEKVLYDANVEKMKQTLLLCDGAITTTRRMQTELEKYVPWVCINRNVASEEMVNLSKKISKTPRQANEIRLGYFSGSITHSADFNMLTGVLVRLFEKYHTLSLHVVGDLEIPEALKKYEASIQITKFVDWKQLPQKIADVDINLAPLCQSVFNEAKSENKWVEAALVKVPTVASAFGAFLDMIENRETGILCADEEEWFEALDSLIRDEEQRRLIADKAYAHVNKKCTTMSSGMELVSAIEKHKNKSILFVLPSLQISGGIRVVLKHAAILLKQGFEVAIWAMEGEATYVEYDGVSIPVVDAFDKRSGAKWDDAIATMWTTLEPILSYNNIKNRKYFVQNYEVDFYPTDIGRRAEVSRTYSKRNAVSYYTMSRWCQCWLANAYGIDAGYVPNGIDLDYFPMRKRNFQGKCRILIEGDSMATHKNVDESFQIANCLDKEQYEIWYMSYGGQTKSWYRLDRFLHQIPYEKVGEIYAECDILLKSSLLESFSYPPLEMMATGGYVVAVPNDGNLEYLVDGKNCLLYEQGNIQQAVDRIEKIRMDKELREKLDEGAKNALAVRCWSGLTEQILSMYE